MTQSVLAVNPYLALFRQAVLDPGRAVRAYAVRSAVSSDDGGWLAEQDAEEAVEQEYRRLDLSRIGGDRPVILRATHRLLSGEIRLPLTTSGLVFEITAAMADDAGVHQRLTALHAHGVVFAVGDYAATPQQDSLVSGAWAVKIDARVNGERLAALAERAHALGGRVIAEGATSPAAQRRSFEDGADLVQGPLLTQETDGQLRQATAGELQCLQAVSLLSQPEVDLNAVARVVAADPELSIRVLHVVNSSAFALPQTVDSLPTAVVLLGPQRLRALAMASLIGARQTALGPLWTVLTRAIACRTLTGDDTGYTVGLLSGVAAQLRIDVEPLVAQAGVSRQVVDALRDHEGRHGRALAAVLAHEGNDVAQVAATGLDPFDVARAYLGAVPMALSTVTALSAG